MKLFSPEYSVVVPVFNSEKTLEELCTRVEATLQKLNASFEIILVNDCSRDNSWGIIKLLKERFGEKLIAIHLRKNSGQHKALQCGFQFAQGEYIITIDDDLQFFPEDIEQLINKAQSTSADLVYGYYQNDERKHSRVRKLGSYFVGLMFEKFGNTVGQGSSFKIIHRSVIDKIRDYNHSFTFIDEILSWHTTKTEWAEVRHTVRREGGSQYSLFRLVFLTVNLIFGYTTIPLRFMTWFGFLSFWFCLFMVIYFVYMKITLGSPLGFTALIVAIFMSTGLILFSMGIIGEYLNRLFAYQHKKPPYLIKEIL